MNHAPHDKRPGQTPGRWMDTFRKAGVLVEDLNRAKSSQAQATILGNFLSQNLGREVSITVNVRTGRARLCLEACGQRARRYYFEVTWDEASPDAPPPDGVDLSDGLDDAPDTAGDLAAPPPSPTSERASAKGEPSEIGAPPPEGVGANLTPPAAATGNQETWS